MERIKGRGGKYVAVPNSIDEGLMVALEKRGITKLFSHQGMAFDAVLAGRDVVVVTPTASGKTLCYNLPIVNDKLHDSSVKAIYLFPTKALSQDQMTELQELVEATGGSIGTFTYDGDTPQDARRVIRARGDIVITNPDMLHTGILPHHTKWIKLFQNLKYIVIDELHSYRGVFGSHMTNVLRRVRRICDFYGSRPQFICCSATIANPRELAEKLIERPVELIDQNGAPSSEKLFFLYNPPVVNKELGIRGSHLGAARNISYPFIQGGIQTIVFATSRLNVEVLTKYLKDRVEREKGDRNFVRGYRGGYLPRTRREIERGLKRGEVLGVVATNALELGIDIGRLDVSVIAGYPGTIASTWQQAGRAGRRSGLSLAVLIGRSLPLDQFIMENPDYFFGRSPEHGLINPDNLHILISHIKCAAFELPFKDGESFGRENLREILEYLEEKGVVHHLDDRWHWMQDVYPADGISLRSVSEENFLVIDTTKSAKGKVIAEVDFTGAHTTLHEGAIYICESELYQVDTLDYESRKAYVRRTKADYYTDAVSYTDVSILEGFEEKGECGTSVEHGEVAVSTKVVGFKKIKFYTSENVGYGKVHLPDQQMHTTSYWLTFPRRMLEDMPFNRWEIIDGILGMAYAVHYIASLHLMCDIKDIQRCVGDRGARWFARLSRESRGIYKSSAGMEEVSIDGIDPFEPTLFIYDNYPGGIGFSQQLFDGHREILEGTFKLISGCGCQSGCPSCVGPTGQLGTESKGIALFLLERALETGEDKG
ncbi:MAG: DEAD/DEAH box helicase [Syntrophobacterales bacterium]|nr:MAG: DEAD/DEAH box helicase [Syntrophobacterales bacterium]